MQLTTNQAVVNLPALGVNVLFAGQITEILYQGFNYRLHGIWPFADTDQITASYYPVNSSLYLQASASGTGATAIYSRINQTIENSVKSKGDNEGSSISIIYKPAVTAVASQEYNLELINDSGRDWVFYVYQKMENQTATMLSLAWFTSPYPIAKGDSINFQWSIDYSFVWGDTGEIKPGIVYRAKGQKSANLTDLNSTTFGFNQSGSPTLTPPTYDSNNKGSLVIKELDNIPDLQFSVGIGMSGQGTFVEQAGPNLTNIFTPTPQYWIAAATERKIGEVLDIQTLSKTQQVSFAPNVYSRKYSLNPQYKWV
ncbi:MAG: hypothetical protein WBG73_09890 [Coleofasciculaceae cyanobacterium]